jgi:hypothetical protein
MKLLFRLSFLLGLISGYASAAEADDFSAVRLADQQRIAATVSGDSANLGLVLSDELNYLHSDGRVQNKAQFIAAVSGNTTKYLSVEPRDLSLRSIMPGAVSMIGRAHLVVMAGTARREFDLLFLAIWRDEAGHWRLLLYQSTQLPGTPAAAVTK